MARKWIYFEPCTWVKLIIWHFLTLSITGSDLTKILGLKNRTLGKSGPTTWMQPDCVKPTEVERHRNSKLVIRLVNPSQLLTPIGNWYFHRLLRYYFFSRKWWKVKSGHFRFFSNFSREMDDFEKLRKKIIFMWHTDRW